VVRESKHKLDRLEFTISDLQKLHRAALEKGDSELADLIKIGAYTGARIEELCRLTKLSISSDALYIKDAKTAAGNRVIPIHSEIGELLQRRASESKDGYLIEGSDKNRYGLRSDPLSKRFGRLKTDLGFEPTHVFHSIRKTFITLLEQEDVPENVTADIVGHEKKTMSYGLYSGGTSLRQKREAIELVQLSLD
jgi:integrase